MGLEAEVHPRAIVSVWPREWVEEVEDGAFVPIEALALAEDPPGQNDEPPPDEEPPQQEDEHPPVGHIPQQNDWSPSDENPSPLNRWLIPNDDPSPQNQRSRSDEDSSLPNQWYRPGEDPSPQNQLSRPDEDQSSEDQWFRPDEELPPQNQRLSPDDGPLPQNQLSPSNEDESHHHDRSHPGIPARGSERSHLQQPVLNEGNFELFDSFIRFPPTSTEAAAIENEQALRRKLNLTVLPLEDNADQDDDVIYTGVNAPRELEEYGFEFEEREEFPDTDESFTEYSSSNDETPNRVVEILTELRMRWCQIRNEAHCIERACIDAQENGTEAETANEYPDSTPLDLSVPRSADEEQQSGAHREASGWPQSPRRSQEAPVWQPSPKRLRLWHGGFRAASVEAASAVVSSEVGWVQQATGEGVLTSRTSGNSSQPAETDRHSRGLGDRRPEASPALPRTPREAGDAAVATDLNDRKAGPGWCDLLISEHLSSPARTRAETSPGSPPLDLSITRSGDGDDDEIVEVGGTQGDGHQENDASASALLNSEETTFYSISGDPYPEMSRRRAQTQTRDLFSCHQMFLPFACLIAWLVATSCLVAEEYIVAALAFQILVILLTCAACRKYALPALRRRWQSVSVASEALQETAVVQHPVQLSELSELHP